MTTLQVDAIVNAANAALSGGGGVDGAIHRAAGPELLQACRAHGRCPPGEAVLTPGFRLPAKYVIHAVGPVWDGGAKGEGRLLESAYRSSFRVALAQGDIATIAFPAISTGVYRFPKRDAAAIAVRVMREHDARFERIVACVFDATDEAIYAKALA
ncbi:MAG: O-acetyl-ADP-ribose deacetylase [Deltaproteobacteria bacterium]|nr:O-acetyl-ADP-ribose deacetylase [Deltaproteobacteria bacterium]